MTPPQLPTSRVKPSSGTAAAAAAKEPSRLAAVSSPAKKIMARPTSAPDLMALAASRVASPSTPAVAPAKRIARPTSSSSNRLAAPAATTAAKPRPPPSSRLKTVAPKKPARQASEFVEPPPPRAAASVHPVRRLTCGTAVYVRTRYVNITDKCCLVIWLPARVVSASDAYHYTVKYAANLHAMFAGRVVRVPVGHVRAAPHRAAADRTKNPNQDEHLW